MVSLNYNVSDEAKALSRSSDGTTSQSIDYVAFPESSSMPLQNSELVMGSIGLPGPSREAHEKLKDRVRILEGTVRGLIEELNWRQANAPTPFGGV